MHVVWYVFDTEDRAGNDITWGMPLEIHSFAWAAKFHVWLRSGTPLAKEAAPGGRYVCDGPVNLLAFRQCGFITDDELGAALRGPVNIASPRRWYHPSYYAAMLKQAPLTVAEAKQASQVMVWTVYYEDRFHIGDARDSYPVAVCLTMEEADAELARRGRPVESGGDGYLIHGPYPLATEGARPPEIGADAVREVLRRAAAGRPGPVKVG